MELEDLPNIEVEGKDFLAYRKKMPPSAASSIENTINEYGKYIDLFKSDIGHLIIKDIVPFITDRIKLICEGKATDTNKIELNIMLKLCDRWNSIVKMYNQKCMDVKNIIKKG